MRTTQCVSQYLIFFLHFSYANSIGFPSSSNIDLVVVFCEVPLIANFTVNCDYIERMSDVPSDANENCPGTSSEQAGKVYLLHSLSTSREMSPCGQTHCIPFLYLSNFILNFPAVEYDIADGGTHPTLPATPSPSPAQPPPLPAIGAT